MSLQAEPPLRLFKAIGEGRLRVFAAGIAIHRLQQEGPEIQPRHIIRRKTGLRIDKL